MRSGEQNDLIALYRLFDVDSNPDTPDFGQKYLHCARCLAELKADPLLASTFSPRTYARQQIAITSTGLQVLCTRHNVNIARLILRERRKEAMSRND